MTEKKYKIFTEVATQHIAFKNDSVKNSIFDLITLVNYLILGFFHLVTILIIIAMLY